MLPRKVIGVEQINDTQVEHYKVDFRPILSMILWAVFTTSAIIVSEVTK